MWKLSTLSIEFLEHYVYLQAPWPVFEWESTPKSPKRPIHSSVKSTIDKVDLCRSLRRLAALNVIDALEVKWKKKWTTFWCQRLYSSLKLLVHAKVAFGLLEKFISMVCTIHSLDLYQFVEEHEADYGESLLEAADLVLTDPPYYIKHGREAWCRDHRKSYWDALEAVVSPWGEVLMLGTYCYMFCTVFQLALMYKLMVMAVEEMEEGRTSILDL